MSVGDWASLISALVAFLTAVAGVLHSMQTRRQVGQPGGAQPRQSGERDLYGP